MSNQIKYKGELLAEDSSILKPGGILYDAKELRADALEANSLQLTVVSESGAIKDFDLNDKVEYYRNGRRRGIYYLQSVTRVGPKSYELYALSAVGRLMAMRHVGGIYTGETAEEIAHEICGDVPVLVETVYARRQVYGWLPYAKGGDDRSARDNLADLLFSIGAWLGTDEDGVLRIEKLWDGTASTIDRDRVDARRNAEKTDKPVSAVAVTEHQFVPNNEETELFSGTAEQGKLVTFDEPMHDLSATGFAILERGANYAVLASGTGILTGKKYTHNTSIVTQTVTAGASENIIAVSNVTLISLVNAGDVAARLADYYAHRVSLTVDVNPTLERAGHVVQIYHPWDKQLVSACIVSRETKVSGLLKSRTTALLGYTPPQPDASQYYDQRVLLTGSGTWTPPEGVTEITRVLIGGAKGGYAGNPGASGTDRTVSWTDTSGLVAAAHTIYGFGPMAKGGAGGNPGEGGKVLRETVTVTPGVPISYSCGVGSEGSSSITDPASDGTATTMGGSSSASGSSSTVGYADPVTGEIFASAGDQGIAGGDGGGSSDIEAYPHPGDIEGYYKIGWGLNGPGSVTDDAGTVWPAGEWARQEGNRSDWIAGHSDSAIGNSGGSIATNYVNVESSWGCPGGAAAGGTPDPSKGDNVANASRVYDSDGETIIGVTANVRGGNGGNGANATAVPGKPSAYGKGGRGGYGGGAGGSPGVSHFWSSSMTISLTKQQYHGTPGAGGSGGKGGPGGDGCVIIYYRLPKTVQPGALATSDRKWFLDRLGRRVIV